MNYKEETRDAAKQIQAQLMKLTARKNLVKDAKADEKKAKDHPLAIDV